MQEKYDRSVSTMKFSTGIIASYETLNHKFDQILRWLTRLTREKKKGGGNKTRKKKKRNYSTTYQQKCQAKRAKK
jgi:hypothetical protein